MRIGTVAIAGLMIIGALAAMSCARKQLGERPPAPTETVVAPSLPVPAGLGVGTYSNGLPAGLGWQTYPDPAASFRIQWRFQDVGFWQDLGNAAPGSTFFGDSTRVDLGFRGNGMTYCYRIRAVKGDFSSAWSEESCKRIGAGEPYDKFRWAPVMFGPRVTHGLEGAEVSWQGVDQSYRDKVVFEVWRRDRNGPVYETVANLSGYEVRFLDPTGTSNSCYRIRVAGDVVASLSPETCLAAAK